MELAKLSGSLSLIASWIGLWLAGLASASAQPPTISADTQERRDEAAAIVREFRDNPPFLQGGGKPSLEATRTERAFNRLIDLGADALPALRDGLRDPSPAMRRSTSFTLAVVAAWWWAKPYYRDPLNIEALLPDLMVAIHDEDASVRLRSVDAIGNIGPNAASAVPALLSFLETGKVSPVAVCFALKQIGPAAKPALPALRRLQSESASDTHLHRLASSAIEAIDR